MWRDGVPTLNMEMGDSIGNLKREEAIAMILWLNEAFEIIEQPLQ